MAKLEWFAFQKPPLHILIASKCNINESLECTVVVQVPVSTLFDPQLLSDQQWSCGCTGQMQLVWVEI